MSLTDAVRKFLPEEMAASLARWRRRARRARVERLPPLSERRFADILEADLGLATGDTVYVGSAVDRLHLDFPFYRILGLIRERIGPTGNVLFPAYPNRSPVSSYQYLKDGNIFDVRRTPSFTGLLSEFARRQKGAIRSLHPTKSVVAIGPDAAELTREHPASPYPYDRRSPYRKLVDHNAKVIGVGVWTEYLSFVYTIDDELKDEPPVRTYHPEVFGAKCVNYEGETVTVETYAHNMTMCVHPDVPGFMRDHIAAEICEDLIIDGMRFFRADAKRLFDEMLWLAKRGITVYPRHLYSKAFLRRLAAAGYQG
jgi:aminoglycoside 3-N-acetyltransferase